MLVLVSPSVTFSGSTSSNIDLRLGSSLKFVPLSDPPVSKKARTSPVWQYFQHFDLSYHPEKKFFRICLICHVNGIDKAVSVGQSASPGPLISHSRMHKAEYLEYVEKKNSLDAAASAATVSNQLSILSFVPNTSNSKELFRKKFAQWVVEQSIPLSVGESHAFISMIKAANKTLFVPDYKSTTQLLYSKIVLTINKLRIFLEGKYYSIPCDHRTSAAHENYGALTLHLIDSFVLKTFV